jgi:hypothetical protein
MQLAYAARELGDEVVIVPYQPFEQMAYEATEEQPNVVIGSIAMCRDAQRRSKAIPGVWANWVELRCSSYYRHYEDDLLQRQWLMLPYGSLPNRKGWLFHILGGLTEQIFIRPDENSKSFTGGVIAKEWFDKWYRLHEDDLDPHAMVVVSSISPDIRGEWRMVICAGRVVTGSQYKEDSALVVSNLIPVEVEAKASELAKNRWLSHPAYVMDLALLADGSVKLVELGSVNMAGLYSCDVHKVAAAIHDAAVEEWRDIMQISLPKFDEVDHMYIDADTIGG